MILTIVWSLLLFASLPLGGFYAIDATWVISTAFKILCISLNIWFMHAFFVEGRTGLYSAFRKYAGYSTVFVYVALCLPGMSWEGSGLIGRGEAAWIWAQAAICSLAPALLWWSMYRKKGQVYWELMTEEEARDTRLRRENAKERAKRGPRRKAGAVIAENLDAFIQVIFMVILIQNFIFQLYVIPSESMVPTMLEGDRPFVVKSLDGPSVPMSSLRLPAVAAVNRGDIVVFENPAYKRPALLTQVFQQFLFLMTLSLVDIDRDENGMIRERFIVKRVTGVPGDRLLMLDDILYRQNADGTFEPLPEDATWAHVNLQRLAPDLKRRIRDSYMSDELRFIYDGINRARDGFQGAAGRTIVEASFLRLEKKLDSISRSHIARFESLNVDGGPNRLRDITRALARPAASLGAVPWQDMATAAERRNALALFYVLLTDPRERVSFAAYVRSGPSRTGQDPYAEAVEAVNLMYKDMLVRRLEVFCDLITDDSSTVDTYGDSGPAIRKIQIEFEKFWRYMLDTHTGWDTRNFAAYPAEGTIPEDHFLLMGDNRYNSFDFRFKLEGLEGLRTTIPLDTDDDSSLLYPSYVGPRLLPRENILGRVAFRLFPIDRIGAVNPVPQPAQ